MSDAPNPAAYRPLFSITVEHDFFADRICRGLQFQATAETEQILQRYQILTRTSIDGLSLYRQDDASGANTAADPLLNFRYLVYAADPSFSLYTAELRDKDGDALHFVNDGTNLLQRAPAPEDVAATDAQRKSRSGTALRGRPVKPCFSVDIQLPESEVLAPSAVDEPPRRYIVRLEAAAMYWKYYFFAELAGKQLEILDLGPANAAVEFIPSRMPVIRGGSAFVSDRPIPMREMPTQRFQLRDKEGTGRILIKRLPNAGISKIGKEKIRDDQEVMVAEIYVNQ